MNFSLLEKRIGDIETTINDNDDLKSKINIAIDTTKELSERHKNCVFIKSSDKKIAVKLENIILDNYSTLQNNYKVQDDKYFLVDTMGKIPDNSAKYLKQIDIMLHKLKKSVNR